MFVDIFGFEDGIDIGQRFQAFAARLVIDYANVLVVDEVKPVNAAADGTWNLKLDTVRAGA